MIADIGRWSGQERRCPVQVVCSVQGCTRGIRQTYSDANCIRGEKFSYGSSIPARQMNIIYDKTKTSTG